MVQIRLLDSHGPLLHLLFLLVVIFANVAYGTELRREDAIAAAGPLAPPDDVVLVLEERGAPTASLPSPPLSVNNPGLASPSASADASGGGTSGSSSEAPKHHEDRCGSAAAPQTTTTITQDDRYIKIAGILVPAIVAIGLGIAGMVVTLHVNSSPTRDDDGNYRS
ncbi:unnamed protein product [Parajaminaea phylloscopi]